MGLECAVDHPHAIALLNSLGMRPGSGTDFVALLQSPHSELMPRLLVRSSAESQPLNSAPGTGSS